MSPTDLYIPESSIILYPQSYNKRGEERLHSVQGVTPDGRDVNVKLRVDDAMLGKESTPSIAEFSREDIKAKNLCLSSVDNGPEKREGVLLFTSCEPDGENRRGIPTYIARWAYVLAAHSEAPDPVIGLGRIAVMDDSPAIRKIRSEIEDLKKERPNGWEALVHHKKKEIADPTLFSFFGHIYETQNQTLMPISDKRAIETFTRDTFKRLTINGAVGGVLIRFVSSDGSAALPERSHEIFPKWQSGKGYQSAESVLGWFFRTQTSTVPSDSSVLLMPIQRYAAGPSFKNYYFGKKPDESMAKLNKWFMVNGEPTLVPVAFTLNKREDGSELFISKYYPLGGTPEPVFSHGLDKKNDEDHPSALYQLDENDSLAIRTGLNDVSAIHLPQWMRSLPAEAPSSDAQDLSTATLDQAEKLKEGTSETLTEAFDAIDLSDLHNLEEESKGDASEHETEESENPVENAENDLEEKDDDSAFVIMDLSNDSDLSAEDYVEYKSDTSQNDGLDVSDIDVSIEADDHHVVQDNSPPVPLDIARILNNIDESKDSMAASDKSGEQISLTPENEPPIAPLFDDQEEESETHSAEDHVSAIDKIEVVQEDEMLEEAEDKEAEKLGGLAKFMKKKGLLKP